MYNGGMRRFIPKGTKLIPSQAECKFKGEIFEVYQWPQELYDGSVATFEMLRRADTVKVVAVLTPEEQKRCKNLVDFDMEVAESPDEETSDSVNAGAEDLLNSGADDSLRSEAEEKPKLVITRQRQPRKDWFYDYPGGRNDNPAEDELDAAKRELLEEAGLSFKNWKLIEVKQPFAKMDWLVYVFLATGLIDQTSQNLDAGEEIVPGVTSLERVQDLAQKENAQYLRFRDYTTYQNIDDLLAQTGLFDYGE